MPGAVTLKILGDWKKEIGVPLRDALAVSMHEFGHTGEKACRQCIYFMTQSAAKLTVLGQRKRPVYDNPEFKHLLRKSQYKKIRMERGSGALKFYFRNTAWYLQQDDHPAARLGGLQRFGNKPPKLAKIGNVGLGKKSWMWGFGKGRPIEGVTELSAVSGASGEYMSGDTGGKSIVNGYVLTNRLKYVINALPSGWERLVEVAATNRIMGRFRDQLESQWRQEMNLPRGTRKEPANEAAFLARYFSL